MQKNANGELMLTHAKQDVSDEVISKLADFRMALKMCKEISGLNDQQIADALKIHDGQMSRIWSGQAHFPTEKIPALMDLCGNWVPMRWLAMHYGQELKPTKTTLERELEAVRQKNEILTIEMNAIKKFMREVKAA